MAHVPLRTVYVCTFQTVAEGARATTQWESICQPTSHPSFYLQQSKKQNRTKSLSEVADPVSEPTSGKPLQLGAGSLPNHPKRAESSDFIPTPKHSNTQVLALRSLTWNLSTVLKQSSCVTGAPRLADMKLFCMLCGAGVKPGLCS